MKKQKRGKKAKEKIKGKKEKKRKKKGANFFAQTRVEQNGRPGWKKQKKGQNSW